jgi:hypothetical protein
MSLIREHGDEAVPRGRGTTRRVDGELILLWALPFALLIWAAAFLMFPGFTPPMSPKMSADLVAAFYRDPDNLPRIRYSMILFNWFAVAFVPTVILIVMQIRRMAHRTPILSWAVFGCVAAGPTIFLVANVFWLLAAFRPERPAELTQMFNDLAWITFTTCEVPFLVAQSVLIALAIFFDDQPRPVFARWVAHFNLVVAAALLPAAFAALSFDGPVAWDGLLSFWLRNTAIAAWFAVMSLVLVQTVRRERAENAQQDADPAAA